jgi:hypothetical protein
MLWFLFLSVSVRFSLIFKYIHNLQHILLLVENYQLCKSVIWRIVSHRKIMSPVGGETIHHITLLQGW